MSNENNAVQGLGFDYAAMMNKGSSRPKTKIEYLKEGSSAYRILPPVSQTNRRLEHTYYHHWVSYFDENGQERGQKVACTKFSDGFCPLCQEHKETEDVIKRLEMENPDSSKIKLLQEKEKGLRVQGAVYLTALNSSNEIVVLQLSRTVFGLLEKKIVESVQQRKFDPTSTANGVWFVFNKQGKGRDSVTVEFKQTPVTVDGETLYKLDRTPIPQELVDRIPTEAIDIHDQSKLYINQYSAKELSDFLRGTPLPQRWKKNFNAPTEQAAAPAAAQTVAAAVTTSAQETAPVASQPAEAAVAQTAGQVQVVDPLEEALRLRKLATGKA